MKKKVLRRISPGDRWAEIAGDNVTETSSQKIVGETLTKALSFIYKKYDVKIFEVDAKKGIVSIDDGVKGIKVDEDIDSLYCE